MPTLLLHSRIDGEPRAFHIEGTTPLSMWDLKGTIHEQDGRWFLGKYPLHDGDSVRGARFYLDDDLARVIAHDRYRRLTYDGLTSTFTRRFLESHLRRIARPALAMAIDLDQLRHTNDIHGLPAGDAAIRRTARVIRSHIHLPEIVARIRGDGFVVTGSALTRERAEQIRIACEQPVLHRYEHEAEDRVIPATVSIALFTLPETLYTLMQLFEQHVGIAKRAGRNRVIAE